MQRGGNYNKFGVITSNALSTSVFATSSSGVSYGEKTGWRPVTHNAALPNVTLRLLEHDIIWIGLFEPQRP